MFEFVRNICTALPLVTEEFPFDRETMVWKVAGKMFCLGNINQFDSINLKCDPQRAETLREEYSQIIPGYHMNKTLWNTVYFEGLDSKHVHELIIHSYDEVVRKLPKKVQTEINQLR